MDESRVAPATPYSGWLNDAAEQFLLKLKADRFPGCAYQTVETTRALLRQVVPLAGEPEPVACVQDYCIPGNPEVPVRLYVPDSAKRAPLIVYFHGGGWIAGDYANIDAPVRALANRSGCAIVSVNYRLAPESKYPAALDDAYTALTWASNEGETFGWDGSRLIVAGDSVGGTLATAVALRSRDQPRTSDSISVTHLSDAGPRLSHRILRALRKQLGHCHPH